MSCSSAFAMQRWAPGTRGGATEVVVMPLFIVSYRLVSTLRFCGVSRRSSTKSCFGSSLPPSSSWWYPRFRQQHSWFYFAGHSIPFMSSQIGLTGGANGILNIESVLGRNVFVGWHNVEVYALPGTAYATFYLGRSPSWPEYESCRTLTLPAPPVVSYFSDLYIRHQPGQDLVWSIAVVYFTILTGFQFLGACCDGTVGFTCHDGYIGRNGQAALGPLAPKAREPVNETGPPWFLQGSSLGPVHSVVALARYAQQTDWTGLCAFDTWSPCH